VLVGIPGTVGGAVRANAGDRTGEIGQFVQKVEVLDENGNSDVHDRDELQFSHRFSNLDDAVLVSAYFELDRDDPEAIVKRMRKAWILRKAQQPHSFEAYARMFKNPRGLDAAALIEQAGLVKTRVGGAEISDRFANSVVVHPGATAAHVVELLNLVESKVRERFSIDLERDMAVW
jgi:UDP-N-acetylmuramate dehydrogenase